MYNAWTPALCICMYYKTCLFVRVFFSDRFVYVVILAQSCCMHNTILGQKVKLNSQALVLYMINKPEHWPTTKSCFIRMQNFLEYYIGTVPVLRESPLMQDHPFLRGHFVSPGQVLILILFLVRVCLPSWSCMKDHTLCGTERWSLKTGQMYTVVPAPQSQILIFWYPSESI